MSAFKIAVTSAGSITCANPSCPGRRRQSDHKWTVALLKLLDDVNAPDYLFTKILTWAQKVKLMAIYSVL